MSSKDDVLIVEDSPAIGMLLKSYLEKLGYTQIHTCVTGSAAITTFNDLVSQNKQPIVLLDYMLPDMDARSVLTQMLEVQPNTRVILDPTRNCFLNHQCVFYNISWNKTLYFFQKMFFHIHHIP